MLTKPIHAICFNRKVLSRGHDYTVDLFHSVRNGSRRIQLFFLNVLQVNYFIDTTLKSCSPHKVLVQA